MPILLKSVPAPGTKCTVKNPANTPCIHNLYPVLPEDPPKKLPHTHIRCIQQRKEMRHNDVLIYFLNLLGTVGTNRSIFLKTKINNAQTRGTSP